MEIEKEIRQAVKFISEYHKLTVNILFTASWLDMRNSQNLKPYDLTPQQFNILRILRGRYPEPTTINMLIERMIDKSSNASRLVDRIVLKGFAQRVVSDIDKRAINVFISEKGLETLRLIDNNFSILEEGLHQLTKNEAKELNRLLDKLRG